jgi:ABC-type sugar transport system permease subunit
MFNGAVTKTAPSLPTLAMSTNEILTMINTGKPTKGSLHMSVGETNHTTWFEWLTSRQAAPYLFVIPGLLLYFVFFIYPFLSSLYLSLTEWDGAGVIKFIGLDNYLRLLQDPMMWNALRNNLIWVLIGTAVPIMIALVLATILWSNAKGNLIFRTIYFMPVVMSPVLIGIIWSWIYNPLIGVLNRTLTNIGLEHFTRGWLGEPEVALFAVLVAAIWSYIGFAVVIIFAGLQSIDMQLIEAAKIDGANTPQRFFLIIIPQLRHVLTMIILYTIIGGFNVFDIVWIMTRGGPANSTEVLATYTYRVSFVQNEVGYGASLSTVMTLLALAAAVIFMWVRAQNEER